MKTFYFNTGVSRFSDYPCLYGTQVCRNGTKQIPFEVPDDAILMFCCDDPNLEESKRNGVVVVPINCVALHSKYAYFKIRTK